MSSSRRTVVQAAGLVLVGAVAGGVLAATVVASAGAPAAAPTASGGYGGPPPAAYAATGPDGQRGPRPAMQSGTVTAVGTNSVGITTSAGAKTYAVDSGSDIDKNGEAKLSDLKAGDAVHFAVRPGTSTIAVLHAGDEAKDGPGAGRHHGPCPFRPVGPGSGPGSAPRPTATPSTNA